MARARRKGKPFNPAKDTGERVYDRRATQFERGAQVAPVEVDDPMEAGAKLIVMRSIRTDLLARLHVRDQIDDAQFNGGRDFQKDFETAERGPRAIDPSKEAVDGGMLPEPITESQRRAARRLAGAYRELGQNGAAIVHDVLVHGQTMEQIAARRGLSSHPEIQFLGHRFRECLDCLAVFYGYAQEKRGYHAGRVDVTAETS